MRYKTEAAVSYRVIRMIAPAPGTTSATTTELAAAEGPPPESALPPTPWKWRLLIFAGLCVVVGIAYLGSTGLMRAEQPHSAHRVQAGCGIVFFLGLAALFSKSLQSVSRKTILWGMGLQFALAFVITQPDPFKSEYFNFYWVEPGLFSSAVGDAIKALITASDKGAEFVFGSLSKEKGPSGFVFAFKAAYHR